MTGVIYFTFGLPFSFINLSSLAKTFIGNKLNQSLAKMSDGVSVHVSDQNGGKKRINTNCAPKLLITVSFSLQAMAMYKPQAILREII